MSLRRVVMTLLTVPALTLSTGTGALADYAEVAANTGTEGIVSVTTELSGHVISASCTFAGVLTPANTLIVNFAGTAVSTPTVNNTVSLLTAIECEINNASELGTNSQKQDFSLNGPATAAASNTLLATAGPKEWPVKDITVCVSAFAVYGPTPVSVPTLHRTCVTPDANNVPAAGIAATGTGTTSPGLTTTPTFQTTQMNFTAYGGADGGSPVAGTGCRYVATSVVPETIAAGAGSGTLGNCALTGTLNYTRVASYMQLTGHVNGFGDGARTHVFGHCTVVYTTYAPGQTWIWICSIFGVG